MIHICTHIYIYSTYRRHVTNLTQKNWHFCNKEQPNLFIQQSSLNIMDVLHRIRFGCFAVYDKDFLRRDESGSFGAKDGKKLDEISGFGGGEG